MKIKLIDDKHNFTRFWSVRLAALGCSICSFAVAFPDIAIQAWVILPIDLKAALPVDYVQNFGIFLSVASIFARLVKQPSLNSNNAPEQPTEQPTESI